MLIIIHLNRQFIKVIVVIGIQNHISTLCITLSMNYTSLSIFNTK